MNTRFLPVTREEMEERGIWQPDFVYITGHWSIKLRHFSKFITFIFILDNIYFSRIIRLMNLSRQTHDFESLLKHI